MSKGWGGFELANAAFLHQHSAAIAKAGLGLTWVKRALGDPP